MLVMRRILIKVNDTEAGEGSGGDKACMLVLFLVTRSKRQKDRNFPRKEGGP